MNALLFTLTLLATLGSGLMAGLFFIFSVTIMDALGRLPPAQGTATMQSINVVILNPIFFAVFFGTAALCLVLAVGSVVAWQDAGSAWLLTGSLLYVVGAILVTMVFNVPMNNALAAVDPASGEGARVWAGTSPTGRAGITSVPSLVSVRPQHSSSRSICRAAFRARHSPAARD